MAAMAVVLVGAAPPAWSQKLPTGGSVTAGSATIVQPNSTTLNINQSTSQAIINWNSFSVGHGGTVNFNQPGPSSATLNRVTGSTPSWIAGTINAPGTVLLVNPNGIEITKSGVVNAGSFAASTLGIKDSDFLSGHYSFSGNGGSAGVINKGHINVSDGGFAALLGGQVANNGVISARLGFVALGAGEQATLDLSGDGFLSVAIPSSQLGNLVNGNGALVSNKGKIDASGGTVFLSAATAANILRNAVNIPGSIRTNSVGVHNGRIVINGGAGGSVKVSGRLAANGGKKHDGGSIAVSGQDVNVTGKLTANGNNGGSVSVASSGDLWVSGITAVRGFAGSGGFVDLAGTNVTLASATIDASGTSGGGLVRIGGTFQGGNGDPSSALYASFIGRFGALPDIASAQTVSVDAATRINVSATNSGNAGSAIVWSQQETDFAGSVIGTGGANGGYAEVSSHDILNFAGTVDLLAPGGGTGTLLLDPNNVIISTTGNPQFTCTGGTCTPTANSSVITPGTLVAALTASNVLVNTGTSGTQAGTITVSSAVNWTGTNTLTLSAANTITINAGMTDTSGSLVLTSSGSGSSGNISVGSSGAVSVNSLTINTAGTVTQSADITATNLQLQGGGTYALTRTTNSIGTLAADDGTGTVSVGDGSSLVIGTVGATNGVTAGTLNLKFASGKGVTQTQAINVSSMSLSGSGTATHTLSNASNSIGTFAASVGSNGTINLTDSSSTLSIGTVNSISGVTAGTLALTASGTVTQSKKLSVSNLALLGAGGNYTLTNGSNSVGTLAANTGSVNFADNANLTIGTVGGTGGVTTTGNLELNVAGTISDPTAPMSVGTFTLDGGDWTQNQSNLPSFTATNFILNGGTFLRVAGGNGSTSPWLIDDIYGLQGMEGFQGSNFALGQSIDASGTAAWSGGGFQPIGQFSGGAGFSGTFNGNGYTINNLYISHPGNDYVGMFGWVNGGQIENVTLANANVTGQHYVGGLVGRLESGTISGVAVGGTVQGQDTVGGLVGYAVQGTIQYSLSAANVIGTGSIGEVGGLVGLDGAATSQSAATGTVTAQSAQSDFVGGLVGYLYLPGSGFTPGSITDSYATGAVNGSGQGLGGLAGGADATTTIATSYSVGHVGGGSFMGGFVGINYGATIKNSYYNTTTTGLPATRGGSAAGITGLTTPQMQDLSSYLTNFAGFNFSTIWIPPNQAGQGGLSTANYPQLVALSPVVYVDANSTSRSYGAANPTFTDTIVVGKYLLGPAGDTVNTSSITSSTLSTLATPMSNVGTYAITDGITTLQSADGIAYRVLTSGTLTVTPATLTYGATANGMTYGGSVPSLGGTVTGFVNGQSLTSATTGTLAFNTTANALSNVGNYAIAGSGLTANNGNYVFQQAASNATAFTITPAALTISAVTQTKVYDGTTVSLLTPTYSGLVNSDTVTNLSQAFASRNVLGTNGSTLNVTGYTVNDGNGGNNYRVTLNTALGTITPATLTYLANANSMTVGGSVPSLSGTVTGFVGHESLASATTGTLAFNTTATSLSPVGSYAITGSGLMANHGNYTFVQAGSNATALTVKSQSASPTSQFLAAVNGNAPNNNVNINFQNTGTPALVHVAFTPNSPTTTAGHQTNNDASPAALPPGAAFTRNRGLDFQPISQYDANQYSQFKLPDYDDKDGEATIFTIIARAVARDHAADFMIDGFWNGTANDWHGADGNNPLTGKVTYSDGAGHDVVPADTNAFPIVPGKTDIARLLKNGPVMLGGAPGQTPAEWLLALNLAPDGKGIVCDDPITGKLVEIAYDQTTETLGSVTGIFDPKIKGFVALADAGNEIPAAAAAAVATLEGFMPSTFFAVTIH